MQVNSRSPSGANYPGSFSCLTPQLNLNQEVLSTIQDKNIEYPIISENDHQIIVTKNFTDLDLDLANVQVEFKENTTVVIKGIFIQTINDEVRKHYSTTVSNFSNTITLPVPVDISKGCKKIYEDDFLKIIFQKESQENKDLVDYSSFKTTYYEPITLNKKKHKWKKCIIS